MLPAGCSCHWKLWDAHGSSPSFWCSLLTSVYRGPLHEKCLKCCWSSGRPWWSSKEGEGFKEIEARLWRVGLQADENTEVGFEQSVPSLSCECRREHGRQFERVWGCPTLWKCEGRRAGYRAIQWRVESKWFEGTGKDTLSWQGEKLFSGDFCLSPYKKGQGQLLKMRAG